MIRTSGIDYRVGASVALLLLAGAGPAIAQDLAPGRVETRWEGTRVLSYPPLIYARDVEDVAITGSGTIDGNARSGFHAWRPRADPDMQRLRRMGFTGVPLEERVFGAGTYLRPSLVQFVRARRVLLEDFTAVNSPFWVNHLVYCEHATVRGIRVESHFPNNDGVDVGSFRHLFWS
jgi:polygalacturonase